MNPKSVAIVGISSKAGSPSRSVLRNLLKNGFDGDIYLVGRDTGTIEGLPVYSSIAEIPGEVELALITLAAPLVKDALAGSIDKGVQAVVVFASGFAEMGAEGRELQAVIGQMAVEAGVTLIGPNCVGYYNYPAKFVVMLVEVDPIEQQAMSPGAGVSIASQSGAMGTHLAQTLRGRGVPVSYSMSTGNEAAHGVAELIEYYAQDENTGAIMIYAEHVNDPRRLLDAADVAARAGKSVVMFHPGRSEKGQEAAASHTGAMAGDYAAMTTVLEASGIMMATSVEDLIDLSELALRFPNCQPGGLGVISGSGAIGALSQDYAEQLGMTVPQLGTAGVDSLKTILPEFIPPRNPLDVGTFSALNPDVVRLGMLALANDPAIGGIIVTFPFPDESLGVKWMEAVVAGVKAAHQPCIYVLFEEYTPVQAPVAELARQNGIVLMRSHERAMRAMAALMRTAAQRERNKRSRTSSFQSDAVATLPSGTLVEWRGKKVLEELGIPVPRGALAETVDAAVSIAAGIGYPVVIKAQASELAHKSDVGGVALNIKDEADLRARHQKMMAQIKAAKPDLRLDGVLVESMSSQGVELIVGARRDPKWGPVLLVGMGGIWIEALNDARLMPASLNEEDIVSELRKLKGEKLLGGFRGRPPVDLYAVAGVIGKVGSLMQQHGEIQEIDINPLIAYPDGVVALDALFVSSAS